jgi:phosphoserine phosphatase
MTQDMTPNQGQEIDEQQQILEVISEPSLVIFDFDGTLAEQRGSWGLLYRLFGVEDTGDLRTEAYWDGELTFSEWCSGNVKDWRKTDVEHEHIERAAEAIKLTTGAPELLSHLNEAGISFGVLSSGIVDLMAGLERFEPAFIISNEIVYEDDIPIDVIANVGPDDKGDRLGEICEEFQVDPEAVLYVGDSHSDIEAFEIAGTSILFDPDDRIDDSAYELVDMVLHERDLSHLIPALTQPPSTP